jgi:hypothetical protein
MLIIIFISNILIYNGLILLISYFLYENQSFVPRINPTAAKANMVITKDILDGLFIEHYP